MNLADKVIIVTGAAGGIGREFCRGLGGEGAKVVAADIQSCDATVADLAVMGVDALAVHLDVGEEASAVDMAARTLERFGRIDVLINNAALMANLTLKPFEQIPSEEWDRVMLVNVKGVWHCCKAVVPAMRRAGQGKIINISSGVVFLGQPFYLHYVASKGAIFALTRSLARELSGTGITVNTITPGFTMTEAIRSVADPDTVERIRQQLASMQVIQRSEVPGDLVGTAIFLSSNLSDFITGQTINVDGGLNLH